MLSDLQKWKETVTNIFHKYLKEGTKWNIMYLLYCLKYLQIMVGDQYYLWHQANYQELLSAIMERSAVR